MNGRRMLATAGRVLAQLRHDPRSIALMLVAPSLLVGLFAWLFSDQDGVFDQFGGAILALFPFIVMFLVTSITTLRERRTGTLERLLSMPLGKGDFILGYTLAFALLAVVQSSVAVGFAVWVCGLDIKGDVWLLLAVAVADAVLGTTLGLFVSAFARTEFQVVQFMPAIVFPQILLGGIFLPRDQLPDVLHAISDWLPLSHAIDALNAVATDSHDAAYVGGQLLVIGAFAVGAVIVGALTLQRRTP
jgi:ABC-2 type transport system permease protein